MKKFLFTICALFVASSTFAANTYSIDKVYLTPTGQANVAVNFSLDEDFACGGYGFTIQLPDELQFVDATVTAGDCYADPPSITSNILPSGALKVGYSSSTVLTKQSGVLLSCKIQAKSSVSAGTVFTANLVDAMFVKAPSTSVAVADASFDIEISDKVILDETSVAAPIAQNGVDVLVKRTIKKGVWNSICLPFKLTGEQAATIFGADMQLGNLTKVNDKGGNKYELYFASRTVTDPTKDLMVAGTPYIIKTSKDITEFPVDNVNVIASPKNRNIEVLSDPDDEESEKIKVGTFYGTFKAGVTIPNNNIFLSSNKLYVSAGKTTIKGFRGYFWVKDFDSSADAPEIDFIVDGETTSIDGLNVIIEDGNYYNLNGMKVENPTKKGVYIKNGKKVVIK